MSQAAPQVPPQQVDAPEKGDVAAKSGSSSAGLPQPAVAATPNKPKMHPAVIISIWIALSSSVIVYNK